MKNDKHATFRAPSLLVKKLDLAARRQGMPMGMYIRRVLMRDVGMLPKNNGADGK